MFGKAFDSFKSFNKQQNIGPYVSEMVKEQDTKSQKKKDFLSFITFFVISYFILKIKFRKIALLRANRKKRFIKDFL